MPKTGGSVFRHKSGLSGLSTAEAREALVVSEGAGMGPAPSERSKTCSSAILQGLSGER